MIYESSEAFLEFLGNVVGPFTVQFAAESVERRCGKRWPDEAIFELLESFKDLEIDGLVVRRGKPKPWFEKEFYWVEKITKKC